MVESTGFENRQRGNPFEGSNPSLSSTAKIESQLQQEEREGFEAIWSACHSMLRSRRRPKGQMAGPE